MNICTFEGCDRKHSAKGLCHTHYNQKYVYKIDLRPVNPRGKRNKNVSYWAAHSRVYYFYGMKASEALCHFCIDMGELNQAEEYAYLGGCPNEVQEVRIDGRRNVERLMSWSPNPAYYRPMCKACHVRYDKARARVIDALG